MDVSKNKVKGKLSNLESNLGGVRLIETVVTLTGLPESLAHQELDQILELSGHKPGSRTNLTLDELRGALIKYLETLQIT